MSNVLQITLNGEPATLDASCTIADLLTARGLGDRPCAVEVNQELVPKAEHAARSVGDGDVVEIVTLVGGG